MGVLTSAKDCACKARSSMSQFVSIYTSHLLALLVQVMPSSKRWNDYSSDDETPRRYCPQEFCRETSVEWTQGRTRRLIMYEHSYHISIGESDIAAFQRGITYATIVKDLSGFLCPWRRLLELWPRSIESRMCRKSNGFSRFLSAFTPNCGGYAAPA